MFSHREGRFRREGSSFSFLFCWSYKMSGVGGLILPGWRVVQALFSSDSISAIGRWGWGSTFYRATWIRGVAVFVPGLLGL